MTTDGTSEIGHFVTLRPDYEAHPGVPCRLPVADGPTTGQAILGLSDLRPRQPRQRGTAFGWMIAVAAALLIVGSFELGDSSAFVGPQQRSQQAQPGTGVPPEMMVVVAEGGKLFHAGAACPLLHDKTHLRTMTASEARREGYTPCVQCMKKYLNENASLDADDDDAGEFASSGVPNSK